MTTAISEKPILFSGPMVRAILDGRKSKTRRVVKQVPTDLHFGRPIMDWPLSGVYQDEGGRWILDVQTAVDDNSTEELICPYGKPGDRLWVKESSWRWGKWVRDGLTDTLRKKYRFNPIGNRKTFEKPETTAKRDGSEGWVYRHARYMPRSECRILLEITDVRAERLQEITEEDAEREGFQGGDGRPENGFNTESPFPARAAFAGLWEELNADRGFGWDQNPFVWVIEFKRLQ